MFVHIISKPTEPQKKEYSSVLPNLQYPKAFTSNIDFPDYKGYVNEEDMSTSYPNYFLTQKRDS